MHRTGDTMHMNVAAELQVPEEISRYRRLTPGEWRAEKAAYEQAVDEITEPYLEQKSRQRTDPVMDFMFTYYSFSPSRLHNWSPGTGTLLEEASEDSAFQDDAYARSGKDIYLDPALFPVRKLRGLRWMISLLEAVENRPPNLNCCGMHEWAMVYETDDIRHPAFPLRLSRHEIKQLVDSHPVNCTHFDAFRFFTPAARPLNTHHLSRESMIENEQPGCLHANMDLYKWCYKQNPWISGELLLDCFRLACKARVLDMKAGPYDLREIGYDPVCIETEEGRKEYKKQQAGIWHEAAPLRKELRKSMQWLLHHHPEKEKPATAL